MRFTVVATRQFSLSRAFGFRLTACSLTQLSVVNSLIRPAGLSPAWQPASPAHSGFQNFRFQFFKRRGSALDPARVGTPAPAFSFKFHIENRPNPDG